MTKRILQSTLLSFSLAGMMYCCTTFINSQSTTIEQSFSSTTEIRTDDGLILLARNKGTQTSDANIDKPQPKKKSKKKR